MKLMPKRLKVLSSPKGQTAVFVLILLIVGLTIGLSLASRTIRDLQTSSGSDLSSRAFSAAEAGVEDALRQDLTAIAGQPASTATLANNATYSYSVTKSSDLTQTVLRDTAIQVGLRSDTGVFFTGSFDLYWVNSSDPTENLSGAKPSLELTLIKNNGGTYSIVKYAVNSEVKSNNFQNPDGSTVGNVKNFVTGSYPIDQITYTNRATITLTSVDSVEAMRIRPVYNKASLAVRGGGLPGQTYVVTSQGIAGTSTRVVQLVRTVSSLPPIFDYVLFNGSTLPLQK
jgi:Tfp pilus assembly protein PilX